MLDEFFQSEEGKEVLTSRAKDKHNSVCISGEDVDGVHKKYSSEYLKWNMMYMLSRVSIHMTDEQRNEWVKNNPPPKEKFR